MKARFLFWTGVPANEVPVRDVLYFNECAEDLFEEYRDLMKNAVAAGVAEAIDNIKW